MRKFKTLALALAALGVSGLLAGSSRAADSKPVTDKKMIISVNPLGLAFGALSANFEYKLNEKASIATALFYYHDKTDLLFTTWESSMIGLGGGYRMYFSPVAMDGWFWEPGLSLNSASYEVTYNSSFYGSTLVGSAKTTAIVFAPYAQAGRQWVWPGGFSINLALGLSYYIVNIESTGGTDFPWSGIGLTGQFSLGYAFK